MKRDKRDRYDFLEKWSQRLREVIARTLDPSRVNPYTGEVNTAGVLKTIHAVNGPRVAGLRIGVGSDANEIVGALERHSCALLRQSLPTDEECFGAICQDADPQTGWYGRLYAVYMPWHDRLAEKDVQTPQLLREETWKRLRTAGDFWVAGLEEHYQPVLFSLDLRQGSPHWFFLGGTTSGKSTSIVNAVALLAVCKNNRFVFIDAGKKGDGLGVAPELNGCVGPIATTIEEARGALAWLRDEMESRYNGRRRETRIIIVIDELPALAQDKFCVEAVNALASAGAQCKMHLFLAAQHAVEKMLGPFAGILKANISGRLIFHTGSLAGSVEGLYDKRALFLQPPGDCWGLHGNMAAPIRFQGSYFPETILRQRWEFGPPEMNAWPSVSKAELPDGGNGASDLTEYQIAEAVRIRLLGRLSGQRRGYGRTVIEARCGVNQNQSVRLAQIADSVLDTIWRVKQND